MNEASSAPDARPPASAPKPARRKRRWIVLLALCAGPLLGEAALRWLLFSSDPIAQWLGADLRRPEHFAPPGSLPEYWKLHMRLRANAGETVHPHVDARIGWRRPDLDPETLLPDPWPDFGGRRPVLWFGASFVACSGHSGACWDEIFDEHSALADDFALINYGVWGHGIDQTLLLLREVLDAWAPYDPVVALGFVAETDLYRPALSVFGWPKPRFALSDAGELVRVDPPAWTFDEYLAQEPIGIPSYAWRAIDLHLRGHDALELRRRYGLHRYELEGLQLSCLLLQEIHRELERRDLEHFGIFFHTAENSRHPGACQAFYDTARSWLAGAGPPMVSLAPLLAADGPGGAPDLDAWFLESGPDSGHLTETGRRALLPLLDQGLRLRDRARGATCDARSDAGMPGESAR